MTKKTILRISIIINIILATVFVVSLPGAMGELVFEYVEQDTIRPDTLRKNLERENYGTVAALSRPIRGGAEVADTDADYYKLGEYAELLFLKEVYERAGNADSAKACEDRISEIRKEMPEYGAVLDKIDLSVANAVKE
jgi:hypothetical protein